MVKDTIKAVNRRVRDRLVETLVISLGLFLALTYSGLIQSIVSKYLPLDNGNIGTRILITAGLTYAVVLVVIALERWKGKK